MEVKEGGGIIPVTLTSWSRSTSLACHGSSSGSEGGAGLQAQSWAGCFDDALTIHDG